MFRSLLVLLLLLSAAAFAENAPDPDCAQDPDGGECSPPPTATPLPLAMDCYASCGFVMVRNGAETCLQVACSDPRCYAVMSDGCYFANSCQPQGTGGCNEYPAPQSPYKP